MNTLSRLIVLGLLLFTTGARAMAQEAVPDTANPYPAISFEGLFYLNYETGEEEGDGYSRFNVHRAYLTTRVRLLPRLSARLTLDTNQDSEGTITGDMQVRLKYAYVKYDFGDWGRLTGIGLEGGIVHMVWLDFEEHVNLYRMRDQMFMERTGMFNSADFGLTLTGGLGAELSEEYQDRVSSSYPARWGSFAVGVYNGGGYHAVERNENKVAEGRLTIRPLPDIVPGFQVSGLAIVGEGNRYGALAEIPDWRAYNVMGSYQFPQGTVTAQYAWGKGNQRGNWTEPEDPGEATDYDGYSVFGEYRFGPHWRVIGGFDDFQRSPGASDLGFTRLHGGVGYDFGDQNVLVFDLDRRNWDDAELATDTRYQVVMQVKF